MNDNIKIGGPIESEAHLHGKLGYKKGFEEVYVGTMKEVRMSAKEEVDDWMYGFHILDMKPVFIRCSHKIHNKDIEHIIEQLEAEQ